jgi:hypothetical protein
LISIAAVLFAAEWVARPQQIVEEDRWLAGAWVVLFAVMFFNASVSGFLRVHLAVIPLTILAVMHVCRAMRASEAAVEVEPSVAMAG